MRPQLQPVQVALKQINFEDASYCLTPWSTSPLPETLAQSIARAGILHPPLLKASALNSFQIIAGRKRLQGVKQVLNGSRCLCLVLPLEAPAFAALLLSLEETLSARPLTPVERSVFLHKARRLLGEGQVAQYVPLLGLPPHTALADQLRLLNLEEPLLEALHAGTLAEQVGWQFAGFPFTDRMALFELFEFLDLDVGAQQQLLASCLARAKQKNSSIFELLADQRVREIIERPGTDLQEKNARLLAWLGRD